MRSLRAIYLSQVRLFTRDKVAVLISVLLPLVLGAFFGYIFGPTGSTPLRIAVVNEDSGAAGAAVLKGITDQRSADLTVTSDTSDAAQTKLREGETDLVITVPAGFSDNVAGKVPTAITASVNSEQGVNGPVALLAVRAIVQEIDGQLSGAAKLIDVEVSNISARVPSLAEFYVPNFLAVSMLWLSIFATALPLVKQREDGTLLRISIAPVSKKMFMAGVTLWRMTVGLIQSALFIAVSMLIVGTSVPIQWPLLLVAGVVLGNLVFTVMGYMIAGLSRSVSGAESIAQAFNFGFLFLSGVFFTAGMLPGAVNRIADFIPLSYLADLFRQTLVGYPALHPLWLDFAVLSGAGLVFSLIALKTWRWQ